MVIVVSGELRLMLRYIWNEGQPEGRGKWCRCYKARFNLQGSRRQIHNIGQRIPLEVVEDPSRWKGLQSQTS